MKFRLRRSFPNTTKFAPWIALILLGALILHIFRDYGLTYDEAVHVKYGDYLFAWYASLFEIDAALNFEAAKRYGGLADFWTQLLANASTLIADTDLYETRHLINALIGLASFIYVFRLGTLLHGPTGGWISVLFLLLTPRFFGHLFNNPKDIPFAAAYTASLYYLIRMLLRGTFLKPREALKFGLATGVALGIRVGGVFLFLYAALAACLWSGLRIQSSTLEAQGFLQRLRMLLPCSFIWLSVSWGVMLLFWPYAQLSPLIRPFEVLFFMSDNPWDGLVFFKGVWLEARNLPREYLPVWLNISLPEFYHICFVAGLISLMLALRNLHGKKAEWTILQSRKACALLLLFAGVVVPIVVVILMQSTLYDGMRHFLFIIPALAVSAGIALLSFLNHLTNRVIKFGFLSLLGFSLILTAVDMIDLHPYQTVYFNRVMGKGLPDASKRFETDYWGNSYKEGIGWLEANFPNHDVTIGVPFMDKRLAPYLDAENYALAHKNQLRQFLGLKQLSSPEMRKSFEFIGPTRQPGRFYEGEYDLYMTAARNDLEKRNEGPTLFKVSRKGTTLLVIQDRRKEGAGSPLNDTL